MTKQGKELSGKHWTTFPGDISANKDKGGKIVEMDLKPSILMLVKNCLEIEASLKSLDEKLEMLGKSTEQTKAERAGRFDRLPEEHLSIEDRTPKINTYILNHYFQKLANAIVEVAQCEAFRICGICREACDEVNDEDAYRQRILEALRWNYKDFEHYREDMIAMLETLPRSDQNPNILPLLYCIAKQKGHT